MEIWRVVDRVVDGVFQDRGVRPTRPLESLLQQGRVAAPEPSLLPDPAIIMTTVRGASGSLGSWDAFFAYQEAAQARVLLSGAEMEDGYSEDEEMDGYGEGLQGLDIGPRWEGDDELYAREGEWGDGPTTPVGTVGEIVLWWEGEDFMEPNRRLGWAPE